MPRYGDGGNRCLASEIEPRFPSKTPAAKKRSAPDMGPRQTKSAKTLTGTRLHSDEAKIDILDR
jgi:hypothetical protein